MVLIELFASPEIITINSFRQRWAGGRSPTKNSPSRNPHAGLGLFQAGPTRVGLKNLPEADL